MNNNRYIQRRDDAGHAAWVVRIQRGETLHIQHFSDKNFGGKRLALQAARRHRDEVDSAIPRVKRPITAKLQPNNTSGIRGVSRHVIRDKTGRCSIFWRADWNPEPGVSRYRKFSVLRYGEEQAKAL